MSDKRSFLYELTTDDHITKYKILGVFIFCLLTYIFLFHIAEKHFPTLDKLTYETCIIPCKYDKCTKFINATKGSNYYLSKYETQWNRTNCLVTPYEISHFIFHIFIGYFLNIYYSLTIGIGFEVWEYYVYNCENYMDIVFNTLGALMGTAIRTYYL